MSRAVRRSDARRRLWTARDAVVDGWGAELLGWAIAAIGLSTLAVPVLSRIAPGGIAPALTQAMVWIALAVPVLLGLRRARPRGLLGIRAIDLAAGLLLGVLVRGVQGLIEGARGVPAAWPALVTTDGRIPTGFWAEAAAGTIVTPVVEELFFRGVVLICLVVLLRPIAGHRPAVVASIAGSTTLFVIAHALTAPRDGADLMTLAVLGAVAGVLTTATGRLAPAVVMHVVFNATGFALLAIGTLLA
ncbi:lysostaphin resistance A-like protein [Microbacterium sp. NPDC090007]|uniref:CPBP family intramembrane glutamic endopeptidase n=1 Tax=Microbacterium sp. NPDC090007 TaxID=3364204 RepID=UPI0038288D9E